MIKFQVNDFIDRFEDVVDRDLSLQIIENAKSLLSKSDVMGRNKKARDSSSVFLHSEYYPILKGLDEIVASLTKKTRNYQEDWNIVRYDVGGRYWPHYDFVSEDRAEYEEFIKFGGQREFTFILYLNDVEEGGETSFPLLDLKFKPKLGTAILFKNVVDQQTNPNSLHSGEPVLKGEKWIAVKWVRENSRK